MNAGASHFSAATRKALARKGITVIGMQYLPGPGCDFCNGETGYVLDDNGTCRIRTFSGVLALAK